MRIEEVGPATLINADCREAMRLLDENSIDAIVCDPPYGLGFMGKGWDHGVPGKEFWVEALRVAKPGAHLLAFGGTRTFHRLMAAIEDAGWEIRDTIMWVYGSGMPKSYNLARAGTCACSGNALQSTHDKPNSEYDVRLLRQGDLSAPKLAANEREQVLQSCLPIQSEAEPLLWAARPEPKVGGGEQPRMERGSLHRAREGVCDGEDAGTPESAPERVCVGAHSGCGENAWALADGRGGSSPQGSESGEQRAAQFENLCDASGALDGRALRNSGCCSRCGKLKKEYEGFGTSLKPAYEPVIVARKPLIGTVAANVQQFGTGAINIDGCRVEGIDTTTRHNSSSSSYMTGMIGEIQPLQEEYSTGSTLGRWPANLIHDGSDEVLALFPDSNGSGGSLPQVKITGHGDGVVGSGKSEYFGGPRTPHDAGKGSAARFFYSPKCSKKDRNDGTYGLEQRAVGSLNMRSDAHAERTGNRPQARGNHHPTVKPTELMRYLCRLVTPPGGTVLDPFMGSGSTGKAALKEGFNFVGVDNDTEHGYFDIAVARVRNAVE